MNGKRSRMKFALAMLVVAACGDSGRAGPASTADGGAADRGIADAGPAEAGARDQAVDRAPLDLQRSGDAGVATVRGHVSLSGAISCGGGPKADCRGTLYVGAIDKPAPLPQAKLLGARAITGADLAAGPIAYEITGLTAGSQVYVSAMLVESGPPPTPPQPQVGDLVVQPQPISLFAGGRQHPRPGARRAVEVSGFAPRGGGRLFARAAADHRGRRLCGPAPPRIATNDATPPGNVHPSATSLARCGPSDPLPRRRRLQRRRKRRSRRLPGAGHRDG